MHRDIGKSSNSGDIGKRHGELRRPYLLNKSAEVVRSGGEDEQRVKNRIPDEVVRGRKVEKKNSVVKGDGDGGEGVKREMDNIENGLIEAARARLKKQSILIVGAMGVGKSELTKGLAGVLDARIVSLDVSNEYEKMTEKYGFTSEKNQLVQNQGFDAHRRWIEPIFVRSLIDILKKYPTDTIIDTGGSHPVVKDPELFTQLQRALDPFTVMRLVLAKDQSKRTGEFHLMVSKRIADILTSQGLTYNKDLNEYILQDPGLAKLANATVETGNKTLPEVRWEVLRYLASDAE